MASYNIVFKPSVEKDLRSLPKSVIVRVLRQIEVLKKNPFPRKSVKLVGAEQLYRIRIGDYRVVYGVDKEDKEIMVHYIRHRREVYRG
jgi:mRNA interferase RelE/StbE